MGGGDAVSLIDWWETYGMSDGASEFNTPVAIDQDGLAFESGVTGLPTQQLIGRNGVILKTGQYHIDESVIEDALAN